MASNSNGIEGFTLDPWKIIEHDFAPENNEVRESIFSLANEYMGTRGNFEEGFDGASMEGCYIGGMYVKEPQSYPWKRPGFPDYANFMVNTTNWLRVRIVVDGEEFSMSGSDFSDYRRELDMRLGAVSRQLIFSSKTGSRTTLHWERFVSLADRHLGAIRLTIKALNHVRPIKVTLALDSRKENRDFGNSIIHCECFQREAARNDQFVLMKTKSTGQYYVHRMKVGLGDIEPEQESCSHEDRYVDYSFSFVPEEGREYHVDKFVSVWTSRDAGHPHGLIPKNCGSSHVDPEKEGEITSFLLAESLEHITLCAADGYSVLRERHAKRLPELWEKIDIEITADPAAQQGARFCLFQLLCTYLGNDPYLNIGPKGYSGECYNGRAFWDTESYCLPFYVFANPTAAKSLVEFRYNTLPAARARAAELNYKGAVYPMTTIDGTEDTSVWEYALGEIHINSIVAYAVFLYTHVTGDKDYLHTKGIEVLVEISRFWASRAAYISFRNGYGINIVMGPDEWSQMVNNNFYTNYLAKWVLEYTSDVIDEMKKSALAELQALSTKTEFDIREIEEWRKIAGGMILNHDPDLEIYVQDDSFLSLDPISREELDPEEDIPIERKWSIEKKLKYQLLKQPDVLLAMFLFPEQFTPDEKRSNYRFYEQRTQHGSSLSPCIHSILASQIGRHNQAYDYYRYAARLDLDDMNRNTHEGLHVTSMSGTWLNIVRGFGGMSYTGPLLSFSPTLPEPWESYSFKIDYRGSTLKLSVDREQVTYQVTDGPPVKALVYGREVDVTSEPKSVPLPREFTERPRLEAVIFDLDGVIVDTAKYHYKAWKMIADSEGIPFDERTNERLKGVSRTESLRIILERADREYAQNEIDSLTAKKNDAYVEMLGNLTSSEILPGMFDLLETLKAEGIKTAICSASKNSDLILERLGIRGCFDAIVNGNHTTRSKPDPEGVVLTAKKLDTATANCLVVEDAAAGIQAAVSAGAKSVGIGDKCILHKADYVVPATRYLTFDHLKMLF